MVAFTVHPPTHTRWLSDADIHASTDLTGKTALVTGATSGLGRAAAAALARRGARVMLGVRNVEAGARVAAAIEAETGCAPGTVTVGPPLDLASNESVRSFAEDVVGKCPRLDLLVNNAGVNFVPKAFTPEGVGVIAQVNFLGPAALTRALEAPILAAAAHAGVANVVHVSSVTHRYASIPSVDRFLTQWDAGSYAATKLANVLFAYECHRRWGAAGVRSAAVDPGAIYSNLWDNDRVFSSPPMRAILGLTYAPPEDGVAAVVTASLAPFHEATKHEGGGGGRERGRGRGDAPQVLRQGSVRVETRRGMRAGSSGRRRRKRFLAFGVVARQLLRVGDRDAGGVDAGLAGSSVQSGPVRGKDRGGEVLAGVVR